MSGMNRRSKYRKHITDEYLYGFPEPDPSRNETIAVAGAPRVMGTLGGFVSHPNAHCRDAAHEVRLPSLQACTEHCTRKHCLCFHFQESKCRFTFSFSGLLHSTLRIANRSRMSTRTAESNAVKISG